MKFDKIIVMGNDIDRLGGIGRFMNTMANALHAQGYDVELVGVAPPPAGHFQAMRRAESIKTTLLMPAQIPDDWTLRTFRQKVDPARRIRHKRRMKLRRIAVAKLRSLIGEWGPRALIICTQVYGMEHMIEAGYDANNPDHPRVIGQYHGSAKEARAIGDMRRVLRSYADVDRFICLTAEDAAEFRRAGLNNVGWIPNPVSVPPTSEATRRPVFVSLGRYDRIKSLDMFIRAWGLIADKLPDWSAELYGEGPERPHLSEVIASNCIPRVTLQGKTDRVGDVLGSSRVHVLSSQNEGLPIAIVEAALLGTPSVAFDCAPGVRSLVRDEIDGFVVALNHVEALAQRMLTLATSPALLSEFSAKAQSNAKRYLPEAVIAKWQVEFDELSQ